MNVGNLALVAASLMLGWIALYPGRRSLGALGYHLSAIPVGLVIWPAVGGVTTLLRAPFVWWVIVPVALLGAVTIAAGLLLFERAYGPDAPSGPISPISYAIAAVAVMVPAVVVNALGLTRGNYDGVFHYHSWGVWLSDTGAFTNAAAGAYGFGIPAMHAVTIAFGGGWTFVIYPMLGLIVAALTGWTLFVCLPRDLSLAWRSAVTAVALALMVTTPMYLYNMYYVHSQMISAVYLVLGVIGALRAFGIIDPTGPAEQDADNTPQVSVAWLVVAGLSCAGLAFARVDGLAYQAVILLVATAAAFASGAGGNRLVPLFASALLFEFGTYAMVAVRIRLWKSATKLSGRTAFALIAAVALYGVVVIMADRIKPLAAWLARPRAFMMLASVGSVAAVALLWILKSKGFTKAVTNEFINLTQTGSWGYLWYFLAGAVLLSLLFTRARRPDNVASYVLFAVFEFMVIGLLVHGTSHVGRLGPDDTFNRMVFHTVPLLFVYIGLFAGGLIYTLRSEAGV